MLAAIHASLLAISLLLLVYIAFQDFLTFRIRNVHVLTLLFLSLATLAADATSPWLPDVAAGAVLFVLGVAFWAVGMMGAGDAKLYFPLGLLVGWGGLAAFAVFLLAASMLFLLAVKLAVALPASQGKTRRRMHQIAEGQGVPYAVPMAAAAIAAVMLGYL
jgi:prepilin peptidase CpaA